MVELSMRSVYKLSFSVTSLNNEKTKKQEQTHNSNIQTKQNKKQSDVVGEARSSDLEGRLLPFPVCLSLTSVCTLVTDSSRTTADFC